MMKTTLFVQCPYCIETCYGDSLIDEKVWEIVGNSGRNKHTWFAQEFAPFGECLSQTIEKHILEAHPTELHRLLQVEA